MHTKTTSPFSYLFAMLDAASASRDSKSEDLCTVQYSACVQCFLNTAKMVVNQTVAEMCEVSRGSVANVGIDIGREGFCSQ
jgi:arginine/lysine/ornithine decarboxylase